MGESDSLSLGIFSFGELTAAPSVTARGSGGGGAGGVKTLKGGSSPMSRQLFRISRGAPSAGGGNLAGPWPEAAGEPDSLSPSAAAASSASISLPSRKLMAVFASPPQSCRPSNMSWKRP